MKKEFNLSEKNNLNSDNGKVYKIKGKTHILSKGVLTPYPKEFNLSEKIFDAQIFDENISKLYVKDVKEFIKRENEIIKRFAQGKLSYEDMMDEREKLMGEKLVE